METVPDNISVIRLCWSPHEITADGQFMPTAFRWQDLTGKKGKYLSVDREDKFDRDIVSHRMTQQQGKVAKNPDVQRDDARFAYLNCGCIRSILCRKKIQIKYRISLRMSLMVNLHPKHCTI